MGVRGVSLKLERTDLLVGVGLFACALVVFGLESSRLGYYYDDLIWMQRLTTATPIDLARDALFYFPGRQLALVWVYLLFGLGGRDVAAHIGRLHAVTSICDAALVVAFFLLLRRLRLPSAAAGTAALLFAFWPVHGETHLQVNDIVMLMAVAWVLAFAHTSVSLIERGFSAPAWLWAIDAGALACGLFTYEQAYLALGWIAFVRVILGLAHHRRRVLLTHAAYLALFAAHLSIKLGVAQAGAPALRSPLWPAIRGNIVHTLHLVFFGDVWRLDVAPILAAVERSDWIIGVTIAVAAAVLLLIAKNERVPLRHAARIFGAGVGFAIAGYATIWVYYIAPRSHAVPSPGIFTAVAAVATAFHAVLPRRVAALLVTLALAPPIAVFAATHRSEMRSWIASHELKRELLKELEGDLTSADILVLEGFPQKLGPAYFVFPQEARLGPPLAFPARFPPERRFSGDIAVSSAEDGVFLQVSTRMFPRQRSFFYRPAREVLTVRYEGHSERVLYSKNVSFPSPPYVVESFDQRPLDWKTAKAGFKLLRAEVAPGGSITLELNVVLPRDAHLAATCSFERDGAWLPWQPDGAIDVEPIVRPLLLARSPGRSNVRVRVRLPGLPEGVPIALEIFEVHETGNRFIVRQEIAPP